MKKIFTLFVVAAGLLATAQAQPGNRDGNRRDNNRQEDNRRDDNRRDDNRRDDIKVVVTHDDPYDRNNYGNSRFSNERKMKMQIAQIDREYDYEIQRVRNSYYLSRWEKHNQVHFLEDQRDREIRIMMTRFKNRGRYNDFPDRHHY
ncbi:MAG: hypothetical protein SGI83_18450 [Bacteroidota bacterium]|nr:hypothetical protein [Bacteroidota bacterium]